MHMASVSQLVEDVARIMGEPRETVNAYARAMLDAGILPKSAGRAIAQVRLIDIVALFTAVCLQPKIKDVAQEVEKYLNLKMQGVNDEAPDHLKFSAGQYLCAFLEILFERPKDAEGRDGRNKVKLQEIVFVQSWPEITVRDQEGVIIRFSTKSTPYWQGYHQRTTVLSGQAFIMLGYSTGRDYVQAVN
jgi:hypothetical protein